MDSLAREISWSRLLQYSQSQLVTIGVLAVTLVPIAAQLLVFWITWTQGVGKEPQGLNDLRFLATELYVGGLAALLAKLIVSLACPERIRRFPYEEDFLIYCAEVRSAQENLGDRTATLADRIAKLGEHASAHQDTWRKANQTSPHLRITAALLFLVGACGVILFLLFRLINNTINTMAIWGL